MGTDELYTGGKPARLSSHQGKSRPLSLSYRTDQDKFRPDGPQARMHTLPTSATDPSGN